MQAAQFLGRQPFPDSVDGLIEQTVMFHALQREHDDDFEVWESSGLGGQGDGIFYDVHEATVAEQGATTESQVEPAVSNGSSVCPAPSPSPIPRSYAAVVAGPPTTEVSGSLVRSQRSEVNFRRSC